MKRIFQHLCFSCILFSSIIPAFAQSTSTKAIAKIDASQANIETLNTEKTKAEKAMNGFQLKDALSATFKSKAKKKLSVIIETGTVNSFVRSSERVSNSEGNYFNFLKKSDSYTNLGGYSLGIKAAKNISSTLFDGKLTIDILSGLVFKQTNIYQHGLENMDALNSSGRPIMVCGMGAHQPSVRDIKTNSIEIPIEIRSNYQINRFFISPTIGIGLDVPLSTEFINYSSSYDNDTLVKNEVTDIRVYKYEQKNINLISKLELSYLFHNNQRLKLSCFYSANITNNIFTADGYNEVISSKGISLGYEIPLSSK